MNNQYQLKKINLYIYIFFFKFYIINNILLYNKILEISHFENYKINFIYKFYIYEYKNDMYH